MKTFKTILITLLYVSVYSQTNIEKDYSKKEVYITMRDGVKLFTSIYIPRDISPKNKYPFLMERTCYNVSPYGENKFPTELTTNNFLEKDKYIFVFQDVRGRYMSEGTFTNMTPQVEHKTKKDIDESTDTYDTIDWLIQNIANNNGKVGQYGISYPGFYTAVGTLANHPALVASSPQAPVSDFYFDDFHHNGAFVMGYFRTFPVFGVQKKNLTSDDWYNDTFIKPNSKDGSIFYNEIGTIKEASKKYYKDNFFMNEVIEHPNYDDFWKKRNILPHLKNVKHAVLTVGGWYDAEDLTGSLRIYKTLEKNNPKTQNTIVMGPFSHGGWASEKGKHFHNDIYFGDSISTFYKKNIENKFFHHYLKENSKSQVSLPEAYMYDTGKKQWNEYTNWPPKETKKINFYLTESGKLTNSRSETINFSEYYSDPNKPVPSTMILSEMNKFTPRNYMSEDQRFATSRPDVLTFTTDVLTDNLTFAGEINANLTFSSTSTDADFVVKLIDIYPYNEPENKEKPNVVYANYHQMVRSEIMPARFRNSFKKPEALTPNTQTKITFPLQDVLHTFKKGHKIQIQVQSTWYPLIAINPQKFSENPYLTDKTDYTKAFIKIFNDSYIEIDTLE